MNDEFPLRGLAIFLAVGVAAFAGLLAWQVERDRNYRAAGSPIPAGYVESGAFDAEALYMHEPGDYSVATEAGDIVQVVRLAGAWRYPASEGYSSASVILHRDGEPGQPIRVEFHNTIVQRDPDHPRIHATYNVHLRSLKDLAGAEWQYGKFGHGTTLVVEN